MSADPFDTVVEAAQRGIAWAQQGLGRLRMIGLGRSAGPAVTAGAAGSIGPVTPERRR